MTENFRYSGSGWSETCPGGLFKPRYDSTPPPRIREM